MFETSNQNDSYPWKHSIHWSDLLAASCLVNQGHPFLAMNNALSGFNQRMMISNGAILLSFVMLEENCG